MEKPAARESPAAKSPTAEDPDVRMMNSPAASSPHRGVAEGVAGGESAHQSHLLNDELQRQMEALRVAILTRVHDDNDADIEHDKHDEGPSLSEEEVVTNWRTRCRHHHDALDLQQAVYLRYLDLKRQEGDDAKLCDADAPSGETLASVDRLRLVLSKKSNYSELKALVLNQHKVSLGVMMVMEAVCILLRERPERLPKRSTAPSPGGGKAEKPNYLKAGRVLLLSGNLLKRVETFDTGRIVSVKMLAALQSRYTSHAGFVPARITQISRTAGALCGWVRAVILEATTLHAAGATPDHFASIDSNLAAGNLLLNEPRMGRDGVVLEHCETLNTNL
jgi:hypothetical protein